MSDEKKLIYADDLLNAIRDDHNINGAHFARIRRHIDDAPEVEAVEVVRCRDCKYWKPSGNKAGNSVSDMEYIGGCEFTNYCRRESDFCSYGERKEGAE